jgi:membrane-bound lytic murein transglycosylase B
LLLTLGLGITTLSCASPGTAAREESFSGFAREMASKHGFQASEVEQTLAASRRQQDIIDAISRPAESMPWYRYRPIFLTESRIREGVAFWNDNALLLNEAADAYGVPVEVIVAILGVETRYGSHKGGYRVIDALRTLAFDYPPRAPFFRSELEQYLLLAREEGFDPLAPKGSYAGAMGMPQFISSSYREYAVDFNGNGDRDLWSETADAVGSVANYFHRHGWEPGEPVAAPATVEGERWRKLTESPGLKPDRTADQLRSLGVRWNGDGDSARAARLLALEDEDGEEYWVTFNNFYVITRYNHSPLYAMAVHQLSRAIAREREEQG